MVFIFRQHYLTSFFLNEFNSPCVQKLPNVSTIMIVTLKLYSYGSYTSLLFWRFNSLFLFNIFQLSNVNAIDSFLDYMVPLDPVYALLW